MIHSIGVIVGSKSDVPKLEKGLLLLDKFGIPYRLAICSAHRDPDRLKETVAAWEADGVGVFIAAAGLAAHLPGVTASLTTKPVIGLPLNAALDGLDSLLSVVQMPPGIPVATVGVDNSGNAAVLAAEILALGDKDLAARISDYRRAEREKAREDDAALGR
ncbi:MAG: 5-(carboxyamino)imidazole ribonucleotide mutase [bacterium]